MNTIIPHLTVASILAVRQFGNARPVAASPVAQSLGSIGLAFLIVLIVFFAMMARAARGMADLVAGFLRVAASMTSGVIVLIVLIVVVLLSRS